MLTRYQDQAEPRRESKLHVSIAEEARSDATGIRASYLADDVSKLIWNVSCPVTMWGGRRVSKSTKDISPPPSSYYWTCVDNMNCSKRTGLEKALHQIEQAIKRPRTEDGSASDAVISNLQDLLSKAHQGQKHASHSETDDISENLNDSQSHPSPQDMTTDDSLALDDAENPLQLLARASDLQLSPTGRGDVQKLSLPVPQQTSIAKDSHQGHDPGPKSFFIPVRASRDVGPDIDPIELGLVTVDEAESLFSLYVQTFDHFSHCK